MTQTKTILHSGSIPLASTTLIIGNKMKKLVINWKIREFYCKVGFPSFPLFDTIYCEACKCNPCDCG